MARRLFQFLLIFALAVPAAAMPLCHAPAQISVADVYADHGSRPNDSDQQVAPDPDTRPAPDQIGRHGCIGCALPLSRLPVIASAQALTGAQDSPLSTTLTPYRPSPDVPPPRG